MVVAVVIRVVGRGRGGGVLVGEMVPVARVVAVAVVVVVRGRLRAIGDGNSGRRRALSSESSSESTRRVSLV